MIATNSPRSMSKLTARSARIRISPISYVLLTSIISMTFAIGVASLVTRLHVGEVETVPTHSGHSVVRRGQRAALTLVREHLARHDVVPGLQIAAEHFDVVAVIHPPFNLDRMDFAAGF